MTDPLDAPAYRMEPLWVVEATYAPDAAETRVPFRPRHLARIARLTEAGTVVVAGAFADMSRSMLVVRAADEAAAIDIARSDIYLQHGIWVEVRASAFSAVSLDPA